MLAQHVPLPPREGRSGRSPRVWKHLLKVQDQSCWSENSCDMIKAGFYVKDQVTIASRAMLDQSRLWIAGPEGDSCTLTGPQDVGRNRNPSPPPFQDADHPLQRGVNAVMLASAAIITNLGCSKADFRIMFGNVANYLAVMCRAAATSASSSSGSSSRSSSSGSNSSSSRSSSPGATSPTNEDKAVPVQVEDDSDQDVLAQQAMRPAAAQDFLHGAARDGRLTALAAAALVRVATHHCEHLLERRVDVSLDNLETAVLNATNYKLDAMSIDLGQCQVERLLSGRMKMVTATSRLMGLGMFLAIPKAVYDIAWLLLDCAYLRVRLLQLPNTQLVSAVMAASVAWCQGEAASNLHQHIGMLSRFEHDGSDVREVMVALEQVRTDPLAKAILKQHEDTVLEMMTMQGPAMWQRASAAMAADQK